ncbi:hypothetical protein ACFT2C_05715 [Promicromonospora sp. NPDC057138]|uniref:hypothetical protein n=1 Tax=Promicromonospora sp. NPDC057138 TaxID=3346031 RepID=UPI00363EA471
MELGSAGEWAGAVVTAAATIVALHLGARDAEEHSNRQAARREIHGFAAIRLRHMDRWDAGTEDPDGDRMKNAPILDAECAAVVSAVDRLASLRRWHADRLARRIYGQRSVSVARLYPERVDPNATASTGTELLTFLLLEKDYTLAVDGDPGPLRRQGASDDPEKRRVLRRAFRGLARV